MHNALWMLGAVALGALVGLITYAWDAADGKVEFFASVIHTKVLTWGMLVLSMEVLAWAFQLVPGIFVAGGILGLVAQAITAFVMSIAWPFMKALILPKLP